MIEHNEITLEKRNQSKVVRSFALPRQTATQPEKSHKFMIIANAIFYGGTEAEKVYLGNDLVWEKSSTPPTPTYGSKTFAGKFLDSSTSSDWRWWVDGKSTSIADKVNPTTKEFNFDYNGTLTTGKYLFNGNSSYPRFERIDHIPDTSQVTDMGWMFTNNNDLLVLNVSDLNTSNVTNMNSMFGGCHKITTISVSNFDTSQVTNMYNMFFGCLALTALDLSNFNTSKVTNMAEMFGNCSTLIFLDLSNFDTSKVTDMHRMFYSCSGLTTLNLSGWNMSSVMGSYLKTFNMFDVCKVLSTVLGPITGIKENLDLSSSPLTNASAMVFINGLAEVTEAKSITFKASTFDTLTPEQIAVATSKGWNVVRSAS